MSGISTEHAKRVIKIMPVVKWVLTADDSKGGWFPKQLQVDLLNTPVKGVEPNVKPQHAINRKENGNNYLNIATQLNEKEKTFLKYACPELTYKEIADKMFMSTRTIDGYRDGLFEKLQLKIRLGLVMYAIRHGIVNSM